MNRNLSVRNTAIAESDRVLSLAWRLLDRTGVLVANVLQQLRIRQKVRRQGYSPWLRVHLWIVNSDLDFHVTEVPSTVPFDDVQSVTGGTTQLIQPHLAIETLRIDDQSVILPFGGRIAHPCWHCVWPKLTAVEK